MFILDEADSPRLTSENVLLCKNTCKYGTISSIIFIQDFLLNFVLPILL